MRSRRRFLAESAGFMTAAFLGPVWPSEGTATSSASRGELDLEDFARLLRRRFRTSVPGHGSVDLELIAANPLGSKSSGQFVLIFRGPPGRPLGQDTYWFEEKTAGRFPMFIVPSPPTPDETPRYVAVFNRLVKAPAPVSHHPNRNR